MDQPVASSSSKVKVEYHDPHNVFPCISADLESKLPLRGLNWNSPGRPLRLIDTLYIEFEPTQGDRGPQSTEPNSSDASRQRAGSQSVRNRDSDGAGARKERRHQFPGLRQTPYLKVLLVRCDDTDTYKSTTRKEIREWIKAHTPPSQKSSKSSNQENHDAFEYMILHVVLPDVDRRVTWPHRNSTKILGYLRDDFGSSSKSAVDRIAQVPSTKVSATDESRATIPDTTFGKQAGDSWESSLSTVKQLILSSFDQRVRQYEDDIKEKRAQRSLPGWNFCTFFVLKEGLSRGFESVGLVEDALSGYDELHAELDAAIRSKKSADGASQDATIFRDVTPEIAALVKDGISAQSRALTFFDKQVIDANKKPYRDLILSSDISVFDFKSYVFSREVTLLERLGGADKASSGGKKTIEPRYLCDICQRATSFIASAGTILRDDALAAISGSEALSGENIASIHTLTRTIVSAWTYAVSYHVLDIMDRQGGQQTQPARPVSQTSASGANAQNQTTAASNAHFKSLLSSRRAALTITARRALQQLGSSLGWRSGWDAAAERLEALESGVAEKAEIDGPESTPDGTIKSSMGLKKSLKKALASSESFHANFSSLTQTALSRHQEAGDLRSTRSMQVDLAIINFVDKEYAECIRILGDVMQQRFDHAWIGSQAALLVVLSQCHKQLEHTEDFVRVSLRLVAYLAYSNEIRHDSLLSRWQYTPRLLETSIDASRKLQVEVSANLENFAESAKFEPYIQHGDASSAFQLRLWIKSPVLAGTSVDKLVIGLRRIGSEDTSELRMASKGSFTFERGLSEVVVYSDTVYPGTFTFLSMTVEMGNIRLTHHFDETSQTPLRRRKCLVKDLPKLKVWVPASSPTFKLDIFEEVNLDKPKSLVLVIEPGDKPLQKARIQLRAASAGLRLHTAEARVVSGTGKVSDASKPGLIELEGCETRGTIRLIIPFQMDHELKAITVHCELNHDPGNSQQIIGKTKTLPVVLPLGVNVQDVFKEKVLFSRFSISSSSGIPLRVLDYELREALGYKATCPSKSSQGFPVFGRQPACLTYKIRQEGQTPTADTPPRLRLAITYQCLDEEILLALNAALHNDLASGSLGRYRYMLEDHVEVVMRTKFTHSELESVALLREVNVPPFDQMDWRLVLSALPSDESEALSTWLQDWHRNHETVSLPTTVNQGNTRKIDIPVDVPPMQVVHTARLRVIDLNSTTAWRVGDTIPAELTIKLTTRWGRQESPTVDPLTFNYELDAPPDAWIIGGQRRGLFNLAEGQELSFPILLLPQRAGHIMLPGLDMRVINTEQSAPQVHCEVDYRSQGESVLVIPAVERPTVGVTIGGARRSWLTDAA